jgi:hypothetical protein
MQRPLCFAKWDRYFYFSGQQWLGGGGGGGRWSFAERSGGAHLL